MTTYQPLRFVLAFTAALVLIPMTLAAQGRGRGGGAASADAAAASTDSTASAGQRVATASTRDIVALTNVPPVVQRKTIAVRGQTINYSTQTGMLPIKTEAGVVEGGMFFMAYLKDGTTAASRPISFIFNGGPGSSSVWLHLGAWGPKRIKLLPDGAAPPPPYSFEDNPHTLLDQTDMVFIDPIGTGYSRAASQQLGTRFWGAEEDLRSVAEFIRLYLTRYDRMASPKFVGGESYGTFRAAGLSGTLAGMGITLNGVILVSTVLNYGYSSQIRGNDLGFINFIPHYTATAWFHKKLPADLQRLTLQQVTQQAERWATTDYSAALMKGNALSATEFSAAAEQLARFTGLSKDVVVRNELRVPLGTFDSELLRDQRRQVGRLDSRFTGFAPNMSGGGAGGAPGDPSMSIIRNTFTPVFTDYVRRELGYKNEDTYFILGGGIGPWNYPRNQYATVVPHLERAFAVNPYMKLFVAEGYYDGATPYFASQYTFTHMSVDPSVMRDNVTFGRYEAGHMMYIDEPSARQLRQDLSRFYNAAITRPAVP